jgi:hypothetical protein
MIEGRVKGQGIVSVRAFVEERFGVQGWEELTERLSPADREELASVLPIGWYPLALHTRLIHALDAVHGYSDLSLIVQLGRFKAERDLSTIHRFFMRFATPALMFDKTADYWRRFHDTGEWKVVRDGNSVQATLNNWACVDVAQCRELVGYLGRVLELAGTKHPIMEHPICRARGDASCVFQARWGERLNLGGVRPSSDDVRPIGPPTPRGQSGYVPISPTTPKGGRKSG